MPLTKPVELVRAGIALGDAGLSVAPDDIIALGPAQKTRQLLGVWACM